MAGSLYEKKLSVRDLVEFLLRSGDIDNRSPYRDPDAMYEGTRLHKKIQGKQAGFYHAEVPLLHTSEIEYEGDTIAITLEGRADGILQFEEESDRALCPNEAIAFSSAPVVIDEIKCVLREVRRLERPVPVHLAQAKVYAAILTLQEELDEIGVQMTYCQIDNEHIRYFTEFYQRDEILTWFQELLLEYCRWVHWSAKHTEKRNESIKELSFPFDYRPGQFELAGGVYRTIARGKTLFIEAPTGVGKTISTVFPAVKSMGESLTERLFYLTAKTITRTVAEDTFRLLIASGLCFYPITLTAKEKVCVLDTPDCNPVACPRAAGHFNRINEAIFALLTDLGTPNVNADGTPGEPKICSREMLLEYADRYEVCPYEMSLDVALFLDAVICDYNYVFDPVVYLRRFFAGEGSSNHVLLIDEAHNLVERGRVMYSATVVKEHILATKRAMKEQPRTEQLISLLDRANRKMLALKRECETLTTLSDISDLSDDFSRIVNAFDLLSERNRQPLPPEVLDFYFELRQWVTITDYYDDHYKTYANHGEDGSFFVRLQCMDPSRPLHQIMEKGRSTVLFSATLLPINYYKSQLSGNLEDYAIYAESAFQPENRRVFIAGDVETRYSRRGDETYAKIAAYIETLCEGKCGNYIAFFPSYKMMNEVLPYLSHLPYTIVPQKNNMTESEKEEFLETFSEEREGTLLGLCVMGGIFSEGIDLRADRLIGAAIVGPGLPQFCDERQLFRDYFDDACNAGFEYAYLYPGMNKVLQSAGRVIRTVEDRGVILLLDERFTKRQYTDLFPKEWWPNERVTLDTLSDGLKEFWGLSSNQS